MDRSSGVKTCLPVVGSALLPLQGGGGGLLGWACGVPAQLLAFGPHSAPTDGADKLIPGALRLAGSESPHSSGGGCSAAADREEEGHSPRELPGRFSAGAKSRAPPGTRSLHLTSLRANSRLGPDPGDISPLPDPSGPSLQAPFPGEAVELAAKPQQPPEHEQPRDLSLTLYLVESPRLSATRP